jgi:hypothetical protein
MSIKKLGMKEAKKDTRGTTKRVLHRDNRSVCIERIGKRMLVGRVMLGGGCNLENG